MSASEDAKRISKAAIKYSSAAQFSILSIEVREQIALSQVSVWIERQLPSSDQHIGPLAKEIIVEIRRYYAALSA